MGNPLLQGQLHQLFGRWTHIFEALANFNITEEERKACKKLIAEMRKRNAAEISKEDQALKIIEDVSKSVAQALYEIIKLYGGRGKGFREAESMGKFLGVVAFKDAVQIFENEEYNAQEGKTTKSVKA